MGEIEKNLSRFQPFKRDFLKEKNKDSMKKLALKEAVSKDCFLVSSSFMAANFIRGPNWLDSKDSNNSIHHLRSSQLNKLLKVTRSEMAVDRIRSDSSSVLLSRVDSFKETSVDGSMEDSVDLSGELHACQKMNAAQFIRKQDKNSQQITKTTILKPLAEQHETLKNNHLETTDTDLRELHSKNPMLSKLPVKKTRCNNYSPGRKLHSADCLLSNNQRKIKPELIVRKFASELLADNVGSGLSDYYRKSAGGSGTEDVLHPDGSNRSGNNFKNLADEKPRQSNHVAFLQRNAKQGDHTAIDLASEKISTKKDVTENVQRHKKTAKKCDSAKKKDQLTKAEKKKMKNEKKKKEKHRMKVDSTSHNCLKTSNDLTTTKVCNNAKNNPGHNHNTSTAPNQAINHQAHAFMTVFPFLNQIHFQPLCPSSFFSHSIANGLGSVGDMPNLTRTNVKQGFQFVPTGKHFCPNAGGEFNRIGNGARLNFHFPGSLPLQHHISADTVGHIVPNQNQNVTKFNSQPTKVSTNNSKWLPSGLATRHVVTGTDWPRKNLPADFSSFPIPTETNPFQMNPCEGSGMRIPGGLQAGTNNDSSPYRSLFPSFHNPPSAINFGVFENNGQWKTFPTNYETPPNFTKMPTEQQLPITAAGFQDFQEVGNLVRCKARPPFAEASFFASPPLKQMAPMGIQYLPVNYPFRRHA